MQRYASFIFQERNVIFILYFNLYYIPLVEEVDF